MGLSYRQALGRGEGGGEGDDRDPPGEGSGVLVSDVGASHTYRLHMRIQT